MILDVFDTFHAKLKKYGYAIKKDKLIIDYRIKDRKELWDRLDGSFSVNKRDYNVGFWSYTNNAIMYSNFYCSKEDFKNYIKDILDTAKI